MTLASVLPKKYSQACATVYGPVQSRRHGRSLGINLGSERSKICSWGCVYCQCGFGERRFLNESKDSLPKASEILKDLRKKLEENLCLDSITFAGNTEPTIHPEFVQTVHEVLKLRNDLQQKWIVNCLSNGSFLNQENIAQACEALDETWIKLDCAVEDQFQRLNRPISSLSSVKEHLFRMKCLSNLRIQTLLWRGEDHPQLGNWNRQNQVALLEAYCQLKPKEIHLTTIRRSTAMPGLRSIESTLLEEFAQEVRWFGFSVKVFF